MNTKNDAVRFVTINDDDAEQRIDNFLKRQLKGVPKSLIYRIIRKGEVRVNKKRIKPDYKLTIHDEVRIPPVRVSEEKPHLNTKLTKIAQLEQNILFEDDVLLILNKPSGLAVHGGSGLSFGAIEGLRALRPEARFLELIHRLDRDTSGVLLIAKKRSCLRELHRQLREKDVQKDYLALVHGLWPKKLNVVDAPLAKNLLSSGERLVKVDAVEGKPSVTRFKLERGLGNMSLIKASPVTGRTHQIRVHCQHSGYSIAGDTKYSSHEQQHEAQQKGIERLFLHAWQIHFTHPKTGEKMTIQAPLAPELQAVVDQLANELSY
ncbi:23S rRNA pseudouridine(955/2504/2580) synthase RluC [Celerinatantimonas sp. YJH-8]|uniref:23S rRNA pseudouridine(955/2504/2580) synthase RluC n=1 Tax=Celerinatantimonas sp. YJH-8 TaxID=3228714 RepID=UPI0038C48BDD